MGIRKRGQRTIVRTKFTQERNDGREKKGKGPFFIVYTWGLLKSIDTTFQVVFEPTWLLIRSIEQK